jgi:hypothetical protein
MTVNKEMDHASCTPSIFVKNTNLSCLSSGKWKRYTCQRNTGRRPPGSAAHPSSSLQCMYCGELEHQRDHQASNCVHKPPDFFTGLKG